MTELLSPEWCAEVVARAADGAPVLADTVIEVRCTGAPRGRGRITLVVEGGRLVSCVPEAAEAAEIELKTSLDDVTAMLRGELDPSVAFMTGDLKTEGPTGPLLALLAALRRPGAVAERDALAATTTTP